MNVQESKLFGGYPQYLITIINSVTNVLTRCVCEKNAKELNRNRCVTY